jgi:hypothetical protein
MSNNVEDSDNVLLLQYAAERMRQKQRAELREKVSGPRRERDDWLLTQIGRCLVSSDSVARAHGDVDKAVQHELQGESTGLYIDLTVTLFRTRAFALLHLITQVLEAVEVPHV